MPTVGEATILHADLDAFYASVEQLLDPSLQGQPIVVGGGVVLAASYEARVFGVRSGMTGWRAQQLCPKLRFVSGHFRDYQRLGDQVMGVFGDFTPLVERVSIDEAFLDVAGTVHLFGSPSEIGVAIRRRVHTEIGLAVSVGIARTKHLAKIASQVAKPDGLVIVEPARERAFLEPLPVGLMWGVGPVTKARLADVGIATIGDLAATGTRGLEDLLGGAVGAKLSSLANNIDPRRIEMTGRTRSVGAQAALGAKDATPGLISSTLAYLADRVAGRLREAGRAGQTTTVRVRFAGMRSVTRSFTAPAAISSTRTLGELATDLAMAVLAEHPREHKITLLAISVSNLVHEPCRQLELPLGFEEPQRSGTTSGAARAQADKSMDAIRARFGHEAVGYASVVLANEPGVPDAFRELAQRAVDREV